jgi:hypothetical protein
MVGGTERKPWRSIVSSVSCDFLRSARCSGARAPVYTGDRRSSSQRCNEVLAVSLTRILASKGRPRHHLEWNLRVPRECLQLRGGVEVNKNVEGVKRLVVLARLEAEVDELDHGPYR